MFAITYKKIFITIGIILVVLSWVAVFLYGLKPSIDFTGGSLLEYSVINDDADVDFSLIRQRLEDAGYESVSVRSAGEHGLVVRMKEISLKDESVVADIVTGVTGTEISLERFNTIGPVAGKALLHKVLIAIVIAIIVITLFVMIAFRKVSEPVPSFRYALATILALIHDISIPAGAFAVLGHFYGTEVDLLFVTAMLAVLGYSINDTIVVFDRIREHVRTGLKRGETFAELVGRSLSETLARSINTSLTLVLTLIVLLVVSNAAVSAFVLALLIGIVAGTYSSIFLASPLLILLGGKKVRDM